MNVLSVFLFVLIVFNGLIYSQIAKYKGKYLGNIIAYSVPSNYSSLWNQVTSENGSKWGSVEQTKGLYNWTNSDLAYNWAKNNNGLFKFHTFVWGSQTPSWVSNASTNEIKEAIENFIKAAYEHYTPMGGIKMIDVVNEPVNTSMPGNMKAALTAGYQSEPANANDKNNKYGWVIWPFQIARKYFPEATLLINEYNIEMNWNNCREPYIEMVKAIKNAPNLTDGKKNLIDGVGLQCHGVNNLTADKFKACIDEIWDKTEVPIFITEFDATADPNEATQKDVYSRLIPVAWEHPHVGGITLWGYIQGTTWIGGNGQVGSGGTGSGIIYSSNYSANPLGDRPAMTWLKSYISSQPTLSCHPDPAPFGGCDDSQNQNAPTVILNSDLQIYESPATVELSATATDNDGSVTKVEFYNGTILLASITSTPYKYSWKNVPNGDYTLKAVATDNDGNTGEATLTIKVTAPQSPYGGTYWNVPGKIEFENYDEGGNGLSYYDDTPGSETGVDFRNSEDVDIEECSDDNGGYNIGYATKGEWLEYSVDVLQDGDYKIILRTACKEDGRTVNLYCDDKEIAKDVLIPNSGGWQNWVDVEENNINLSKGTHILKIEIGNQDYVNLNYMTLELKSTVIKIDDKNSKLLQVYPNPMTQNGNIKIPKNIQNCVIEVYNRNGNLIVSKKLSGENIVYWKKLGIINSGVYVVLLKSGKDIVKKVEITVEKRCYLK